MTREQELERAIEQAKIPHRDYRVYRALFRRATWKTGVIETRWQPKSIRDIARDANIKSRQTVYDSLGHLDQHGWICRGWRDRDDGVHVTDYGLLVGGDCDCTDGRAHEGGPMTGAERARRYRARKKTLSNDGRTIDAATGEVSRNTMTQTPEVSRDTVTHAPGSVQKSRDEVSRSHVTKCPASRDDFAGQAPNSGKEGAVRGKGKEETVLCEVCATPMSLALANLGYGTHPCCEPGETHPGKVTPIRPEDDDAAMRVALRTVTGILGAIEVISDTGPVQWTQGKPDTTCIACSKPARRACRTCWPHAHLELSA